jgi:hypothetical protein
MAVMEIRVTYDNGDVVEASVGQRDIARWEAQPFGGQKAMDEKPITFARFVAWSALQRAQRTNGLKWEQWDATVDEVDVIEAPEELPDPTQ